MVTPPIRALGVQHIQMEGDYNRPMEEDHNHSMEGLVGKGIQRERVDCEILLRSLQKKVFAISMRKCNRHIHPHYDAKLKINQQKISQAKRFLNDYNYYQRNHIQVVKILACAW